MNDEQITELENNMAVTTVDSRDMTISNQGKKIEFLDRNVDTLNDRVERMGEDLHSLSAYVRSLHKRMEMTSKPVPSPDWRVGVPWDALQMAVSLSFMAPVPDKSYSLDAQIWLEQNAPKGDE